MGIKKVKKIPPLLFLIFVLALVVRFLYFPKDVYFAYDQARDAYASLEAVSGDFKILGPPATFSGIHHGSLFYYIFGPIYSLFSGNPNAVSLFIRVYNALGVFLIFAVGKYLFKSTRAGLISSFIYAVSFEQTQYSLFLGHPSLAVLTVLLFYFGMIGLITKKRKSFLVLALVGLGLSIQFHFSMINLLLAFFVFVILFRKIIPKLDLKTTLTSLVVFVASVFTYILAELKFNFRMTRSLLEFFTGSDGTSTLQFKNVIFVVERYVRDNIVSWDKSILPMTALLVFVLVAILLRKGKRTTGIVLSVFLFGGLFPYLFRESFLSAYHYGIGGSFALVLLMTYLLKNVWQKSKLMGKVLLIVILVSNMSLIGEYNPKGTIPEINVQDGMLLSDQKKAIDYMYEQMRGDPFSVSALTVPYGINTTWSYVFEMYALDKYGHLPIWGREVAGGFYNNLKVISAQSELPPTKFIIIEPERGVQSWTKDDFLREEGYFWETVEEKKFGKITVRKARKL
jgi:4-amino-4-deoxy-L-arabinose transferase-like glycosyltransferase